MKKGFIFTVLVILVNIVQAQDNQKLFEKDDLLVIGKPVGSSYQHLNFPKSNVIIKRGAIADFNSLLGEVLYVDSLKINKEGSTEVVLRRKDGVKFFRFFPKVTANLESALEAGELKILKL